MHPGIALTIVFTTAIVTIGIVLKNLIDARYRSGSGAAADLSAVRGLELLSNENAALRGQIGRLEERLSVLERIVTDPAISTAHEIERLR